MKTLFLLACLPLFSQITSNVTAYWKYDESAPASFAVLNTYADSTGRGHTLTVNPDQRAVPSTLPFRLGANSGGVSQNLDGSLANCGKWNRAFTPTELTALAGGEKWPFSTTTSLQDAVAYFLLNEASNSATYADATGRGNTLTRSGTTTQVTGPLGVGNGTQLTPGVFLEANPPTADLQSGNFTFSVGCWVNLNTKPSGGQSIIWGQITLSGTPRTGEILYYQGTSDNFNIDLGNDNGLTANGVLPIGVGTAPATGTWFLIASQFNATTSIMSASVDNGTTFTFARNVQPGAVAAKIANGAQFVAAPGPYANNGVAAWDVQPVSSVQAPNSSDLTFGNNSKTAWFWFKSQNTSPTQSIEGFYDQNNTHIDWLVQLAGGNLFFLMGNNAGSFQDCSVPFTDTASFHLVVVWFDQPAQTLHLNLDHGAASCSHVLSGLTPAASSLPFWVGSNKHSGQPSGAAQQCLCIIDESGIANGAATSTDLDTLWNGGAGITFSVLPVGRTAVRGLVKARGSVPIR